MKFEVTKKAVHENKIKNRHFFKLDKIKNMIPHDQARQYNEMISNFRFKETTSIIMAIHNLAFPYCLSQKISISQLALENKNSKNECSLKWPLLTMAVARNNCPQ